MCFLSINIFVFFIFAQYLAQRGIFNMCLWNLDLEDLTLFYSPIPGIGSSRHFPGGASGPMLVTALNNLTSWEYVTLF